MSSRAARSGFTLIESLIVMAVVATLSAMIIPNMLSAKSTANEGAVVSTLKTITTAQSNFKSRVVVDRDSDGEGEYGYFAELAGLLAPRGQDDPIVPIILSPSFQIIQNGNANRSGYLFHMALSKEDGSAAEEAADGGEDPANPSGAESSEAVWVCYAWPKVFGSTGSRVFVVNQAGDILQTNNDADTQRYSGDENAPASDAAFTVPARITSRLAINAQGNDGGHWRSIR